MKPIGELNRSPVLVLYWVLFGAGGNFGSGGLVAGCCRMVWGSGWLLENAGMRCAGACMGSAGWLPEEWLWMEGTLPASPAWKAARGPWS